MMEISFTRIGLLMEKQFIENKKLYLFGTLTMMSVMTLVFFWRASFGSGITQNDQGVFLGIGMVTFGCLFSLTLFSKLDTAKSRTELLMLPTTVTEKMVCAVLFAVIIFPAVYIITVYPLLRLVNYADNNYLGNLNEAYKLGSMKALILSILYITQALALLCSVFFRPYKLVKSIAFMLLLFFGSIYLYSKTISLFLPYSFKKEIQVEVKHFENSKLKRVENKKKMNEIFSGRTSSPFSEVKYFSLNHQLILDIPTNQKNWFYLLLYLSIPCMWFITWQRLKESEVI